MIKPCTNTVTSQHMQITVLVHLLRRPHIRAWVCHPHLSWHLYWQRTLANADKGTVLQREAWEAAPISCKAAIELFGADNAHPMSQVTPLIPHLSPSTSLRVSCIL